MMQRNKNSAAVSRAFTLVELMVVIFILGLLLTFTVVAMSRIMRGNNVELSKNIIGLLEGACQFYEQDFGEYPPSNDPTHPQWAGGQLLVLYLTGPAPDEDGDGVAGPDMAVDDGVNGYGYRLVRGGRVYEAYHGAEEVRTRQIGNADEVGPYFVDMFGNPIYYYVYRNDTYYASDNPDGPLTSDPNYATDANNMYYNYDFLLMSAGPDRVFESLRNNLRTNDITNFLPED
jgi:prepilin-type N-terminal cleavage/methylation domain-containing protein